MSITLFAKSTEGMCVCVFMYMFTYIFIYLHIHTGIIREVNDYDYFGNATAAAATAFTCL